MSLYNKYRPNSFEEIIGQESLKKQLKQVVIEKDLPEKKRNLFIFFGPYGTGKTTFARIFAKELGCSDWDLTEVDAGTYRGVDSADQLKLTLNLSPSVGKIKVVIIDEIQEASASFQGSLLKVFEEPPKHVYFILCTTNIEKINKGILSRANKYTLQKLNPPYLGISLLLNDICKKENINFSSDVIREICKASQGIYRNALSILESIVGLSEDEAIDEIRKTVLSTGTFRQLCQCLYKKKEWNIIYNIVINCDNSEKVRRGICTYFEKMMDGSYADPRAAFGIFCFKEPTFNTGTAGLILQCFKYYEGDENKWMKM